MSTQAHPRPRRAAGGMGRFGYNVALLVGCVLPVSGAAMLGVLWMQDKVPDLHDGLWGLGLTYLLWIIPFALFGAMFLAVVTPLAALHPEWKREIALCGAGLCAAVPLSFAGPLTRDSLPGWIVLGAALGGWAAAVHLVEHARPTETEWIVAAAPGVLLAVTTAMYAR
ncbi:hypothetical protein [Longimicrobium terrae]|uniref:Uncharacterized protein n=1 Tax=Longimicrobium terrae TaxID=1639882 RepID=A0A841H5Q1_9BACT|nr:hypothetical protein [Longimicrobium terrae]MBB4639115.1 hypothetical protein [Longimicrobium terrae]MBB6073284.1 hypothetical protein [Longimicrobium terrae]NNC28725.1 hypothetical protein [Longimicrobium terrae]